MQVLPMPCCGAEPPTPTSQTFLDGGKIRVHDTTDWSKFGWDPETRRCRACGAPQSDFQCASPTCTHSIAKDQTFCTGCAGAAQLASEQYRLALRNVLALARKMKREVDRAEDGSVESLGKIRASALPNLIREAPDHLIRFCAEAGVEPSILRDVHYVDIMDICSCGPRTTGSSETYPDAGPGRCRRCGLKEAP